MHWLLFAVCLLTFAFFFGRALRQDGLSLRDLRPDDWKGVFLLAWFCLIPWMVERGLYIFTHPPF